MTADTLEKRFNDTADKQKKDNAIEIDDRFLAEEIGYSLKQSVRKLNHRGHRIRPPNSLKAPEKNRKKIAAPASQ